MSTLRTYPALLAVMACWQAAPAVAAAVPRVSVVLHGASVRLSDLFDGLEPGQDCDIGPAPTPGRHLIVPPAQLAAIATQFGVDLQGATIVRSMSIERPARTVTREEIVAALKPALIAAGMPADSDIGLGAFASPSLAADNTASPAVASLDYDGTNGRFSAGIDFASPDGDPQSVRVTGRAEELVRALTLVHPLPAGAAVTAADLIPARIHRSSIRGTLVTDVAQASGFVTRQPLTAGTPLLQDELLRPVMVDRGRAVVLRLSSGGLTLTAAGTALEAGGDGDRVHVMNSVTRAVLLGTVVGPSDVMIDPGTAPVFLAQAGATGQLPRLGPDAPSISPNFGSAQEAQSR